MKLRQERIIQLLSTLYNWDIRTEQGQDHDGVLHLVVELRRRRGLRQGGILNS